MQLYGYWRSTAAYRVRIVMHLKNIPFESVSVHLVKNGGEQHEASYVELNPTELVPTLVDGDVKLHQSIAIMEYLDAKYPEEPLYPTKIDEAALVKALALDIACEIHPLNNLRVQQYLSNELKATEEQKIAWMTHWMAKGFAAVEKQIAQTAGLYCFGDVITMADICLVPQLYNANRFGIDLTPYPTINKVAKQCALHPAFVKAAPEHQPDAI